MTEAEELMQKAKNLVDACHELPQYKRYQALKEELHKNKELNDLLKQSSLMKNSARFLSGQEKQDTLKRAKEYYDRYEEDPLVINYKAAKEELIYLLSPLIETQF